MARGEISNERLDKLIRIVGVMVPFVLIFHIILLSTGILPGDRVIQQPHVYLLMTAWLGLSIHQFMRPTRTPGGESLHIALYHMFCAAYLLFVCGLGSPVVYMWALLPVAAYQYAGMAGYWASMAAFVAIAGVEMQLYGSTLPKFINLGITFLGVTTIGSIMTIIADELVQDRKRIAVEQMNEHMQRDRLTTIINNLADAIIATDAKGVIDTYNAAALNLLDTNHALNGVSIDKALSLTDESGKKVSLAKLVKLSTKVSSRDDLQLKLADETLRLSIIFSPIKSMNSESGESSQSYVIIMRDITRQKSLEEERDEFISVVSHELRTPITIAEGALSNVELMQQRGIATPKQIAQGITMAHDQVLFLAGMINDLSTLSRAERGVMSEKSVIAVEPFIHDIYNQYSKEAHKKKLQFNLDLAPQIGSVEASELYLHELLQNFITNALKYTKQGSVTLQVQKKDGKVQFAVKDTGIGISKNDQQMIFNKFFRSEDYRTRETAGTGLGLYVAKKLAHLLGTNIHLESRLNHGSTFSFELPQK